MPSPLDPRSAYELLAPTYEEENVVTALDREAIDRLSADDRGGFLLDLGCGTGRRLDGLSVPALGVDLVPEMLAQGRRSGRQRLAAGRAERLPLRSGLFSTIWCRLVIGHLASLHAIYTEIARVGAPSAQVLITDFHPHAIRAGWSRTFRCPGRASVEIEHHVHTARDHEGIALQAGLAIEATIDLPVGRSVRSYYERAGKSELYESQLGMPLLLAIRMRRIAE